MGKPIPEMRNEASGELDTFFQACVMVMATVDGSISTAPYDSNSN